MKPFSFLFVGAVLVFYLPVFDGSYISLSQRRGESSILV